MSVSLSCCFDPIVNRIHGRLYGEVETGTGRAIRRTPTDRYEAAIAKPLMQGGAIIGGTITVALNSFCIYIMGTHILSVFGLMGMSWLEHAACMFACFLGGYLIGLATGLLMAKFCCCYCHRAEPDTTV